MKRNVGVPTRSSCLSTYYLLHEHSPVTCAQERDAGWAPSPQGRPAMASDANDEGMRGIGYAAASERELSETAAASSSAAGSASERQLPETADEGTIPVDATVAASSESERQLPETSSEGVIPVDLEDEDVETEDPEVVEVNPTTRRIKHWADAVVESDDATASTQQLALPPQPSSADEAEGWQKAGGKKKNKAKQGPNKHADVDRIQQFLLDFKDEVV